MNCPAFLRQWMTERDNATFCAARALLVTSGVEMMVRFWQAPAPDYQSFGTAIAALGVAIAAKNFSEK